ncbi:RICIN domain-containing protein [Paraflavitalea sp. CAU 1676]|uniref:RICIN domain-containing protein n=1 Tax=Paraflavitalea sp. CAU 1676 TaxID=3032598 RepID=UPI0023D9B750|nr:RICIN domain-containing protein [Paraflavitalea sp. CAU 1676]MDF2192459.1 RICIN domain-containing protein [Paraflavitalea sp. CAU 1676]
MKHLSCYLIILLAFASCSKNLTEKTASNQPANPAMPQEVALLASTAGIKGVNWADPDDNFEDGWVVISGLSSTDNYATTQSKAGNIINAFQQRGANTVRMPVNPPTVLESWWTAYSGAIDTAVNKGFNVILAYWEGASSRNGTIDNTAQFWNMWQAIVNKYGSNSKVYFEPFNEPHGYNATDLKNIYATWLSNYPSVPHGRVLLDGAGYAQDVNVVGSDSRFVNCLLSYHNYTWFDNNRNTVGDWEAAVESVAYPDRTVVTEFGIPTTNGKNYLGAAGTDREIAYFQGMTNRIRTRGMGCVYWPGLRNGDGYSLLTLSGTTLTTNNASGLTRLQFAWNNTSITQPAGSFNSSAWYRIVCRNSNKSLDVNGQSTANGGAIVQWDYWGGNNQQWKITSLGNGYYSIINRNSNKALDVNGSSTTGGTGIVQWDYWGGNNQQWQIIDMGFGYFEVINRNSGLSLDVNGQSTTNGATVIQWPYSGGRNQQWQIVQL